MQREPCPFMKSTSLLLCPIRPLQLTLGIKQASSEAEFSSKPLIARSSGAQMLQYLHVSFFSHSAISTCKTESSYRVKTYNPMKSPALGNRQKPFSCTVTRITSTAPSAQPH